MSQYSRPRTITPQKSLNHEIYTTDATLELSHQNLENTENLLQNLKLNNPKSFQLPSNLHHYPHISAGRTYNSNSDSLPTPHSSNSRQNVSVSTSATTLSLSNNLNNNQNQDPPAVNQNPNPNPNKKRVRRQVKKSKYPKITDWTIEKPQADLDLSDNDNLSIASLEENHFTLTELDTSINKAFNLYNNLSKSSLSSTPKKPEASARVLLPKGIASNSNLAASKSSKAVQRHPSGSKTKLSNIPAGVNDQQVENYTIKHLKSKQKAIQNEPKPDTGQLALEKIANSETLKLLINEKAAKATHIGLKKGVNLYSDPQAIIPIENPLGEAAILQAAKNAKLKNAPLIVIPPKPEATIGEPDINNILPSDGTLSYSTPSWENFVELSVENKNEQVSIADCCYDMGRLNELYEDLYAW